MTKQEFRAIVDNLFAGNRLARGIELPRGPKIDLQEHHVAGGRVRLVGRQHLAAPAGAELVIDVYGHEDRIVALGRVIVYLLAEDAGHLSIFVGARSPGRSTAS